MGSAAKTDWEVGQLVDYVARPPMSCQILQGDPMWYVMLTANCTGASALAGLVGRGFRCYGPTVQKRIMKRGRRAEASRDMFPGYVLADLRPSIHDFKKARTAPGVVCTEDRIRVDDVMESPKLKE